MSYPWFVFTVTFADGHEEDFQATGLGPTDALGALFGPTEREDLDPLRAPLQEHGEVVKVEYSVEKTRATDAHWIAELARDMQADVNIILNTDGLAQKPVDVKRILTKEEATASDAEGTPPQSR